MVRVKHKGNFNKTEKYLKKLNNGDIFDGVEELAQAGVEALKSATPVKTGKTADSWSYSITKKNGSYTVTWNNSNVNDGVNIAMLIQYDHGTGTGGFVEGIDYINPTLSSVFDEMVEKVWKEASKV